MDQLLNTHDVLNCCPSKFHNFVGYQGITFFGIMVYFGKQIKTSNMLQQRAEGVEEKRRRLGRLRRERSTLAAVSRGDRPHSYCDVWGVGGWGDRAASASSGYWVASWTSSRRTS